MPRWWFGVILAACLLSRDYSWYSFCDSWPERVLCWPAELAPTNLDFLAVTLPAAWTWSPWADTAAHLAVAALGVVIFWLAIRRFAPPRIRVGWFVAILIAWPVASYAILLAVAGGLFLLSHYTHGG